MLPPQIEFAASEGPTAIRKSQYTVTHKATNSVYFDETKIFQVCAKEPNDDPSGTLAS